ncbi:MAG TPA: tryptophan synthase subunit beta [Candidatus Limnocylindrales bacterium]|nr:tryptophan synthase subunit beta [Candidatus Limnocylindrales bacterium]
MSSRAGVLDEIAARRAHDLALELEGRTAAQLTRLAEGPGVPAPRDVVGPLLRPGLHLIAEVKRRSPSAGSLAPAEADLPGRARAYERGGAAAVSVLCEPHWFGGTVDDLRAVRAVVSLPVLAKEFVVDPRQLPLLRAAGADAVLLIAVLHPRARLAALVRRAFDLGLEPLVEAHDRRDLDRALASGARLVGLNSRDLRTLEVDPERSRDLRAEVPDDRLMVAESGIADPAELRSWRALGFDAALVGESLMRAGTEPEAIAATVGAFVAAGREPSPSEDPAAADRAPFVKICAVTDVPGALAAVRAGADAIGLNFVPGTRRALSLEQAQAIVAAVGVAAGPQRPRLVGVFADRPTDELRAIAETLDLDVVQLNGEEPPEAVAALGRPCFKVLHLPAAAGQEPPDAVRDPAAAVAPIVARARIYLAQPNLVRLLLDTADPHVPGGTGRRADPTLAAAVAREVPVTLAGGLEPANVAAALQAVPARGVDVASGVEFAATRSAGARPSGDPGALRTPEGQPRKDPFRVGLFVKRARAARLDRPQTPSRPTPVPAGQLEADAGGRWGADRAFGGRYVPETLVAALQGLEAAWADLRHDPRYWTELRELRLRYVGAPSPLYRADRLAADLERQVGRRPGGLHIWLKREDLNHTGAHKITNALGQALLTRRLGKTRVIAETGAGQHGVATATACALLDLPCVVYMGAEDIRRQAPNVDRMRALGAEVRAVRSGSATLKDAVNEAMRDWVTNVATTHYVLGSAVGPHPYPTIVRDLQRSIGDDAAAQLLAVEGRLPDAAVACLGGGSNGIGLFSRFIGEPQVRLIGVEAAGEGMATGRHAAALAGGRPGILHGARSYLLQDEDGQVTEAVSLSAGLDYPGIGPQLAALYAAGRLEIRSATDAQALDALRRLTRCEGILPALESAHALAALPELLPSLGVPAVILLGLSGRGDKDLAVLADEA